MEIKFEERVKMEINEDKIVVEYITTKSKKVQTVVNADSLHDAQRQVEARDNVYKVTNTRYMTPFDEFK